MTPRMIFARQGLQRTATGRIRAFLAGLVLGYLKAKGWPL